MRHQYRKRYEIWRQTSDLVDGEETVTWTLIDVVWGKLSAFSGSSKVSTPEKQRISGDRPEQLREYQFFTSIRSDVRFRDCIYDYSSNFPKAYRAGDIIPREGLSSSLEVNCYIDPQATDEIEAERG